MNERFTDRSRKVMQLATKIAKDRGDFYLGIHHILIALLEEGSGVASNVLKRLGVDVATIYNEAATSEPACGATDFIGCLLYTPNTKKALEEANEAAIYLGHNYVGTEHLLLGLLKTEHPVITQVLNKAGVDYNKAYDTITTLLSNEPMEAKKTPSKEEIAINFYRGVLKRIMKICEENSDDKGMEEILKIAKRAILDGGKWNIS